MPDFAVHRPQKRQAKKAATQPSAERKVAERQILVSGETKRLPSRQNSPFSSMQKLLEDVHRRVRDLGGPSEKRLPEARRSLYRDLQANPQKSTVETPDIHRTPLPGKIGVVSNPLTLPPTNTRKRDIESPAQRQIMGVGTTTPRSNVPAMPFRGTQSAHANVPFKETQRAHANAAAFNAPQRAGIDIEERNIRVASPVMIGHVAPKSRRRRPQPIVSGADREAYRQVFESYSASSPAHLPSAARLAQLLRADYITQKEGRPNSQLAQMAQAVREGRRREVADMNPEHVQKIVHTAMGGAHKAEQLLSSPSIHRMIERHNTLMRAVHTERSQREHQREVLFPSASAARGKFEPQQAPGISKVQSASTYDFRLPERQFHTDPARLTDEKFHEEELLNMLATNEAQHVGQVSGDDKSGEGESAPQSPFAAQARSQDRVLAGVGTGGTSFSKAAPMSFGGGSAPTPPVMPFSSGSAPKGMASQVMSQAAQSASQQSGGGKKKQKLEGTLKMIGANGQVSSGGAEISGTLG